MTSIVTKYAAKKLLGKQMDRYKSKNVAGEYDPYYQYVSDPNRPGKRRKVKKQIPDYIPDHDAIILSKARRRAYHLDMALFNFCGVRFGWSSVLGLVPALGDTLDLALAAMLIRTCNEVSCKLGPAVIIHMLINIALDFFIGLIPFIGDLGDAAYKCNSRNVRLLEQRLDEVYNPEKAKHNDPKKGRFPATVVEYFSDEDDVARPEKNAGVHEPRSSEPRKPQPARLPTKSRSGR